MLKRLFNNQQKQSIIFSKSSQRGTVLLTISHRLSFFSSVSHTSLRGWFSCFYVALFSLISWLWTQLNTVTACLLRPSYCLARLDLLRIFMAALVIPLNTGVNRYLPFFISCSNKLWDSLPSSIFPPSQNLTLSIGEHRGISYAVLFQNSLKLNFMELLMAESFFFPLSLFTSKPFFLMPEDFFCRIFKGLSRFKVSAISTD